MNNLLTDSLLPDRESSIDGDIQHGPPVLDHLESGMDSFFIQVQVVDKHIENLSKLSTKLQDSNEESKSVTKASAMKTIKHRMEKDIDEMLKIARKTKIKLEEMETDNVANRQRPGCGMGSAVDRFRAATTIALKEKLKERIIDIQFLRETIYKEYCEVVERRFFTVTGNRPSEETINQLIETGISEQIFQKAILEQGQSQVTATLAEIEERYDIVKDLGKKLLELQQIFLDMEVFVDKQGANLNTIESQVSGAEDHSQSAAGALLSANNLRNKSRKWIWMALIVVLLIAILVVVVVLAVIRPWSNSS